jgi:DNA-binding transcriptional regulator LsrR (DeoR family)
VEQAVRAACTASVAAGAPLSQRSIAERFGLSRRRVSQLIANVTVESNGHALAGKGA